MLIESSGGLGNQLFLWNLAHILEENFDEKIWIAFPGSAKDRDNQLSILMPFCKHKIGVIDNTAFSSITKTKDKAVRLFPGSRSLIERVFRFVEVGNPEKMIDVGSLRAHSFIRGFHQVSSLVDQGFPLFAQELLDFTEQINSLTLLQKKPKREFLAYMAHVRRGDFVNLRNSYGILDSKYYTELANERNWEFTGFVTDSESSLTREFASFSKAEFFTPQEMSPWEGFSIMSHAKELAIANSTLSWWAGKVCRLRGGSVFAPSPWHRESPYSSSYLFEKEFKYRTAIFQ